MAGIVEHIAWDLPRPADPTFFFGGGGEGGGGGPDFVLSKTKHKVWYSKRGVGYKDLGPEVPE